VCGHASMNAMGHKADSYTIISFVLLNLIAEYNQINKNYFIR